MLTERENSVREAGDRYHLTVHPKELSQLSVDEFQKLVPAARLISGEEALFELPSVPGSRVRVKRAVSTANQIHVWWGEPMAVHAPRDGGDVLYVLPVTWQRQYARQNPGAAQHASHAFDCMAVRVASIPSTLVVAASQLEASCAAAAAAAAHPLNRALVTAIKRAHDTVADVLIESLGDVIDQVVGAEPNRAPK